MSQKHNIHITTIGGGSGQPALLRALSEYDDVELSAIVTTMDSGGSSGILREQYNIIPPGDIRRCLSALSPLPDVDRWWNFREQEGLCAGHPLGNVVLAQLNRMYGSMQQAIQEVERIFQTRGHVFPVADKAGTLCAELLDGSVVEGEHNIDVAQGERQAIARIYIKESLNASQEALAAIAASDVIVLSFGDVWTSLLPNFLVNGLSAAIAQSNASVILVCNRSTKHGETDGWSYADLVSRVSQYLAPATLSVVMYDDHTVPVPTSHEAFRIEAIPGDIHSIVENFADSLSPEKLSAKKIATTLISYARLH